ncbi:hypothetical protein AMJ57_05345 [Parcubacteria bacterium SG8_24]|nr:MAG: hypothetical protein AMJ57_05345 [Parcubacteria bacterium SG8_24]
MITLISASAAYAAEDPKKHTLTNPLGTESIPTLVGRITQIFLGVAGSFALLMFVYGGFVWLTSGGSPERVAKGKKIFTWATIGLIIMFGAYTLVSQIFKTLEGAG